VTEAQIVYERTDGDRVVAVTMTDWPPTTWLLHLDEPMKRFDPETGEATEYDYVALTCKDSEPRAAYVFPSTAAGEFVDASMTPMRTRDYGLPHSVMAQLGYAVTN
jgi:hypothetical protein